MGLCHHGMREFQGCSKFPGCFGETAVNCSRGWPPCRLALLLRLSRPPRAAWVLSRRCGWTLGGLAISKAASIKILPTLGPCFGLLRAPGYESSQNTRANPRVLRGALSAQMEMIPVVSLLELSFKRPMESFQ